MKRCCVLQPSFGVQSTAVSLLIVVLANIAAAQSGTRTPYSPPPPPKPRDMPVTLVIRLPADAVLEIQGTRTQQQGEVRRFTSPPLPPGQQFTYTLKGTWQENGQPVVREKAVPVRAGEEINVDLRESPAKK
jgi:uncharacterized protein (TIGR03000 family)